MIRDGVSDVHCMGGVYLADKVEQEYNETVIYRK